MNILLVICFCLIQAVLFGQPPTILKVIDQDILKGQPNKGSQDGIKADVLRHSVYNCSVETEKGIKHQKLR